MPLAVQSEGDENKDAFFASSEFLEAMEQAGGKAGRLPGAGLR